MTTLASTLYTHTFPRSTVWQRNLLLVFTGALFVSAFAQIKIPLPFTPVPLTGQTFAVLLIGATLGSKRGSASIIIYTAMGAFGLPVFSGGASGLTYLTGATFGYFVGFILAAYFIGRFAEYGLERHLRTSLIPFLIGTLIIYLFGAGWLAILFGVEKAFSFGILPFLAGDLIKLLLATLVLPTTWRFVHKTTSLPK